MLREAFQFQGTTDCWRGAHLDGTTRPAGPLPLPARDERGEGWGEGFVPAVATRLDAPLPTPWSWGEGTFFSRNGGTNKMRRTKAGPKQL